VILLRLVDPDDIVEQEIVTVSGREPPMGKRGPADHHGPQLADL
jgi:hypothetical protein